MNPVTEPVETFPEAAGRTSAVITTTGPDKAGVSAALFRVLSSYPAELVDVEQAIFSGRIMLAVYVKMCLEDVDKVSQGLRNTLSVYGQHVTVEVGDDRKARPRSTHVLVLMGKAVTAEHMSAVTKVLANYDANVDRIRGISRTPITSLEMHLSVEGSAESLRKELASQASQLGVDIAFESAGLERRARRLICFDCDSTLITGEVIEMLAAHAGKEAEVAEVTERAMRGELDFEASLRERVKTLAGLPESVIHETAAKLVLTPGVRTTIATLKKLGYRVAVVSGGFIQVLEDLAQELELDYVRANTLEVEDGKLTGRVIGKVVDRAAKEEFLREFAADAGLQMSQTIAVGDGANDIDMITAAGLGIAFNAKPALREVADAAVNHPYMDEILHILGIPRDEVVGA